MVCSAQHGGPRSPVEAVGHPPGAPGDAGVGRASNGREITLLYAHQTKNHTLEVDAAIRIRAERRLGEMIGEQKRTGVDAPARAWSARWSRGSSGRPSINGIMVLVAVTDSNLKEPTPYAAKDPYRPICPGRHRGACR